MYIKCKLSLNLLIFSWTEFYRQKIIDLSVQKAWDMFLKTVAYWLEVKAAFKYTPEISSSVMLEKPSEETQCSVYDFH